MGVGVAELVWVGVGVYVFAGAGVYVDVSAIVNEGLGDGSAVTWRQEGSSMQRSMLSRINCFCFINDPWVDAHIW